MSNSLLYDPLLVRYLALELDARLRGRICAASLVFPGERRAVLPLDAGEALSLDLHPARGWIQIVPWEQAVELEAEVSCVEAPPDERLLVARLNVRDRFQTEPRSLWIELQTNQWNAVLVDGSDRIVSLAWTRAAGGRDLRSGSVYEPPVGQLRFGAGETPESLARREWARVMAAAPPERRRGVLLESFAYTGTPNAGAILGVAEHSADTPAAGEAFQRWWNLRSLPSVEPVLLRVGRRTIPYPVALQGCDVEPVGSLLEAMDLLARAGRSAGEERADSALLARVEARRLAITRRIARLEQELAGAERASELRAGADLLLARVREVPKGVASVELEGWDGAVVRVELDPALSPVENANRMYEEARRRERGRLRVSELLDAAHTELRRWDAASRAAVAGAVPDWVEQELSRSPAPQTRDAEPALPYRRYRTSGGLEARVGKSARGNDDLTFRHAAPNDVWLHARSVPGSHVILRWRDESAAPPARDLHEAAGLAAVFSRARSSGLVAVDWTRRKHVRKPRGAPPGAVIPQRVKTVFVEPDSELPERLRDE